MREGIEREGRAGHSRAHVTVTRTHLDMTERAELARVSNQHDERDFLELSISCGHSQQGVGRLDLSNRGGQ